MEIIAYILIALGSLSGPEKFNERYVNEHPCEVSYASKIYADHRYYEINGGVIIDDDVEPCDCK